MIYLNNRLVTDNKAKISVFDHGFLYGDGVYETLRAYEGVVFMIDEHIERLFRSASMINLDIMKTPGEIKKAIYQTIKKNRLPEAYIRVSVSRGKGAIGLDPELCKKPTFVIMSFPFKEYPAEYYKKGVKIIIADVKRNSINSLNPQIKSLNFLNNILAKIEAKQKEAYEAIMLNLYGKIAEGTITNVFFVKNNILCTPSVEVGILDGITRRIILDIAKELNIKTKEGEFTPEDIYKASEVFISNTTMELMPVSVIDNIKVRVTAKGITKTIHKKYKQIVAEYISQTKSHLNKNL
jgi:branched-chain amino acid aminotransferase